MLRFFALALALPSAALAETWTVDASHSDVSFSVTHMMVSDVTGTFGTFTGTAQTDDSGQLTGMRGAVTISSVNTRNEKRDGHLQAADFFNAEAFPKATFESTGVVADGDGYKVTGTLTIRDKAKSVVWAVEKLRGPVKDPWGGTRMGAMATTTIDRQDFDVSFSKTMDGGGLVVGNEVRLTLRIELKKEAAE